MSISQKIFSILDSKGMSQKEFSKRTGISESTVSDWKKKGNTPKAESLITICRALDISLYDLLSEESAVSSPDENAVDYMLTGSERSLIEIYREMDTDAQKRILSYFETLSNGIGAPSDEIDEGHRVCTEVAETDTSLLIQKQMARRLRKLARLDRIKLDESEHSSGLNLHLYKYMDYLGMDKLSYIKQYLSNIQPFMLTEIKSQEKFENAICVIDRFYRISVYIKVDATKGEEVIVSFHENNKNGIARKNPAIPLNTPVYCFADSIGSHVEGTDNYSINLFITRGVRNFPINVPATRYDEDGFLVRYTYINNALIDIVNGYLEELYTSDTDYSDINPFSSLQQLSFTSYGNDVFSNISLMVDSILIQKDAIGKQIADAALVIYCNSIEMNDADKKELTETLHARYSVSADRALPQIIERVEMNL